MNQDAVLGYTITGPGGTLGVTWVLEYKPTVSTYGLERSTPLHCVHLAPNQLVSSLSEKRRSKAWAILD